jgi:hypothetical protein
LVDAFAANADFASPPDSRQHDNDRKRYGGALPNTMDSPTFQTAP